MPVVTLTEASVTRATLEDLYKVEGKAELIGGRIIHIMGSGRLPSRIAYRITKSLDDHVARHRLGGEVFPDGVVYAQRPPLSSQRESFQPDASYCLVMPTGNQMRFIDGAPVFAVEVRSENDYGPAAERDMNAKRRDYFEAGTLVVWDVDPMAETISVHRVDTSHAPAAVYGFSDEAEAEPTVPGWRVAVSEIFA